MIPLLGVLLFLVALLVWWPMGIVYLIVPGCIIALLFSSVKVNPGDMANADRAQRWTSRFRK